MRANRHRYLIGAVIGVVLVCAGVAAVAATLPSRGAAGPEVEPAALTREPTAKDALPTPLLSAAKEHGYMTDTSKQIAPSTYLVQRSPDLLCVMSTVRNSLSSGCNQTGTFFHGEPVVLGLQQTGGGTSPVSELRLFGIARREVASVVFVIGSKVAAATSPTADGGFVIDVGTTALADGGPRVVNALGKNGKVIESYTLPQG